ncbi:MAG: InlB B-repeat-containing protein [Eggerthellaceae bacterium]
MIDIATMTLEKSVVAGTGQSQSAPLISVQGDGIYAYFTCNSTPGGVYRYKLGDDAAEQLFVPEGDMQNYCLASIVADAEGNLYYTNDSGTLFKLSAAPSFAVSFESNGGSAVSTFRVAQGKPMTRPGDPTREGHLFLGWFSDEQLTQAWDFSRPVTGDMTLYAKWGEDVNGGVRPPLIGGLNPPSPQGDSSSSATSQSVSPSPSYSTRWCPPMASWLRAALFGVTQSSAALVASDDEKLLPRCKRAQTTPLRARKNLPPVPPLLPQLIHRPLLRRSIRSLSRALRSALSPWRASWCISSSRVVALSRRVVEPCLMKKRASSSRTAPAPHLPTRQPVLLPAFPRPLLRRKSR